MKKIKIVSGGYGHTNERGFSVLKTAADPPFDVADEEAERLVELGVARVAEETASEDAEVPANDSTQAQPNKQTPPDTPTPPRDKPLAKMTMKELIAYAGELGITAMKANYTKADLIEAIKAALADDGSDFPTLPDEDME